MGFLIEDCEFDSFMNSISSGQLTKGACNEHSMNPH